MRIDRICVGQLQTNCYVVVDETKCERFCAVVDPGDDPDTIARSLSCNVTHVILTHAHFDHVGALPQILAAYPNALFAVGEHEPLDGKYTYYGHSGLVMPTADILLSDGDTIGPFSVIWTPGHTKGSICLYSENDGVVLSGDTLFAGGYGRTDLGGSMADMQQSLKRLSMLPPQTVVLSGHGGHTTIGAEFA